MLWLILILFAIVTAQATIIMALKKRVDWLWTYVAGEHDSSGRIIRIGIYDWVNLSIFANAGDASSGDPDGIKPPSSPPPF